MAHQDVPGLENYLANNQDTYTVDGDKVRAVPEDELIEEFGDHDIGPVEIMQELYSEQHIEIYAEENDDGSIERFWGINDTDSQYR